MKRRLKEIVANAHILKLIPNSLTLCNSLCGFAAILYTLKVYDVSTMDAKLAVLCVSAWIILFAMLFDALDGFAARIFNAASMTGLQMDSLSDMVTFGVAPATLVAVMANTLSGSTLSRNQEILVYLLCAVYLGGAALRLAIYNVHAMIEHKSSDKFSGLPSPGAAAAVCCVVLFARECGLDFSRLVFVLPVYAAVLGLLMVSSIPYTHMAKWCFSARRHPLRVLLILIALFVVAKFQIPAVAAMITLYILSGPFMLLLNMLIKLGKHEKKEHA